MHRLPSLNALRVFDVAARLLNFSAAAEALCVTHSAVSHQIRFLEDWFDCRLFIRSHKGVILTEAGQHLRRYVSEGLHLLEEGCAQLGKQRQPAEVVLGASGSFLANWLIPRLESFETAHADICIRLQTQADLGALQKQQLDALIINAHTWPRSVEATPLFKEQTGPVCAPDWAARFTSPQALLQLPLLHTRTTPRAWPDWAEQQGLDPAAFTGGRSFDHLSLTLEAAAAGLGVAIAPALLVERALSLKRLCAPLGFIACGGLFAFCTLRDRRDERGVAAVRAWLEREVARERV